MTSFPTIHQYFLTFRTKAAGETCQVNHFLISDLHRLHLINEMPPIRRSNTASRRNQATLSFGTGSRVTKPANQTQNQKSLDPIKSVVSEKPSTDAIQAEQAPVTPTEPSQPHVAELAVRQQAKSEVEQPWSEEDEKASKITEQDLKRYWKQEETKRKAPRG